MIIVQADFSDADGLGMLGERMDLFEPIDLGFIHDVAGMDANGAGNAGELFRDLHGPAGAWYITSDGDELGDSGVKGAIDNVGQVLGESGGSEMAMRVDEHGASKQCFAQCVNGVASGG